MAGVPQVYLIWVLLDTIEFLQVNYTVPIQVKGSAVEI